MKDKVQIKIIIEGIVQGVFYRGSTREAALQTGVTGWVKNMPDRTVHAVIQGEADKVEQMTAWCRQGPPSSRVDRVHTEHQAIVTEFDTFEIKY